MNTYVFFRDNAVIGIMVCNRFLALTAEQHKKLADKGITVVLKHAQRANHDGDINRCVDTLLEKDWLG